jgi:hypothetical protein
MIIGVGSLSLPAASFKTSHGREIFCLRFKLANSCINWVAFFRVVGTAGKDQGSGGELSIFTAVVLFFPTLLSNTF